MKHLQLFLFALIVFALPSCASFPDGSSVWQKGLWIAPWATFIGSVLCFVAAYRATRPVNAKITESYFVWFGVALLIATILIVVMVNADK